MLSTTEIKRFIDDDIASERKHMAGVGQKYYEAEHDILKCRLFYYNMDGKLVEDTTRSNVKICHPFFTELVDQLPPYMLSFEENPIRAKEKAEGLQEYLDVYFNARFWSEIGDLIAGAYAKGFEYIYAYKGEENRLVFQCADSMGVVEVRAADTDDGCKYIIFWYIDRIDKGRKTIKRIQVWNEKETAFFVQSGNGRIVKDASVEVNPRPHVVYTDEKGKRMGYGLGYIPFWRLDNNKKRVSGLRPIKALIDDYDRMQCGLSNNLADFDIPLYVVSGFQGDNLDELQQNLKTKKMVGVPDAEGGIEVKTVDIPYQARKAKADEDEKNIYRFGKGLDTLGLKDTNATTNLAIRAAYSFLEMKACAMTTRLEALLDDILPVVLAEINAEQNTDFKRSDIEYRFKRSTPTNETENIANEKVKAETQQIRVTTILNISANIGEEQTLKALCEEMELDFEEIQTKIKQMKEEQDIATAQRVLEGVVTDDEQTTEIGSATVSE